MRWLNYHHLFYFWQIARSGSISEVSKELRLAQPTISTQLKALEDSLGHQLFDRDGRKMRLTEVGRMVFQYADEIFSLGKEMVDVLEGRPAGQPQLLKIGIADVVPKYIAHKLIQPAFELPQVPRLMCFEDKPEKLLTNLATQELDLVISDSPISPSIRVKAYNHFLGESAISFMGVENLAKIYRKNFPKSLEGAPLLLPLLSAAVRRDLDRWFEEISVRPQIVGEFEDSALMKIFAEDGRAIFVVPSVVEDQVKKEGDLRVIGRTEDVKERFYLISVEKKVKHPAVVAICTEAQRRLFEVNHIEMC